MVFKLLAVPGAVAAVITLTGCANWNAVKKDFSTKQGAAITIDAKQRAIYSVDMVDSEGVNRDVMCAEPSPDALSSLAANLGLDASVAAKSLGLAFSSQEAAASIGLRTQTIQTLRDAMYRLCEGYAGGALDDVGFVRLQRRYQAVMLGLLAIEQLTGATVASQAALSSSGGSRVGPSISKISSMITEARQTLIAAQVDLTEKRAAATAKTTEITAAEAALKKATEDSKGQETEGLKTAREAHKTRSDELAKLEADRAKAQQAEAVASADVESLEQLRKEVDRASAFGGATAQLAGVANAHDAPRDTAVVAEAVQKIVTAIVSHDYSKEACLDWMLSRSMREGFSFGQQRYISLVELQIEICRQERQYTHELDLAKIQAANTAATKTAAGNGLNGYPPTNAASAPSSSPSPAPNSGGKPKPAPAPTPAPAPKPMPSPAPLPPPPPPPAVKPSPTPAAPVLSPRSETSVRESEQRVKEILEKARSEQPAQRQPSK